MKCRLLILLTAVAVAVDSLVVSDPACSFCEPGTLCLAWNSSWLKSSASPIANSDFRLRLSELQALGRSRLLQCGGGWRVSHILVRMPLSELLPTNARSSGPSSVFYQFFLGPSGQSANVSGGARVNSSQGAMVLGHAKHQQACAHFSRRLPPAKAVAARLCGVAEPDLSLSLLLVPGGEHQHYRRDADGRPTAASACGFCSDAGTVYFDSAVADLTSPGGEWQLLLPVDRTDGLDITASPLLVPDGIVTKCPFRCDNRANCISQDRVCDKKADCYSGADEEAAFCREIQLPQTGSEPSSKPHSVWWAVGVSLAMVLVLAFLVIQTVLLVVRHKDCSLPDGSSDASSEDSKELSGNSDSGSGSRRRDRLNPNVPRSRRPPRRKAADVDRLAAAAASGRSQLCQRLLAGRRPAELVAGPDPPPPPILLSTERLREMHRQRRLRQMAGAVPPPPRRLPPPLPAAAEEDSGAEFDEPMLPAADLAINAGAGAAGQRPSLEDSGIGDGPAGLSLAFGLSSQFRFSSCVPRIPNRRILPPQADPDVNSEGNANNNDNRIRRFFGRFF